MSPSDSRSTDGGQPIDEDIFTQTADVPDPTADERLRRFIDVYVRAPASVALEDVRTIIGGTIVLLFFLTATVGVAVIPEPSAFQGPLLQAPWVGDPLAPPYWSLEHPLGTNAQGADMFKLLVHSSDFMLKMILAGALLSIFLGTVVGTVSGYKGGPIASVLMTVTDVLMTIPGIVLVVVIASVYTPKDPVVIGVILGIDNWPRLARAIRSQVLSLREESFTEASRVMGLSEVHILRRDIITNLMPYISVNFAFAARSIIIESVALYFLGLLPFDPNMANWGVMMNRAYRRVNLTDPAEVHWLVVPMVVMLVLSLGFILLAQGIDRVFNVRLRARHANTVGGED